MNLSAITPLESWQLMGARNKRTWLTRKAPLPARVGSRNIGESHQEGGVRPTSGSTPVWASLELYGLVGVRNAHTWGLRFCENTPPPLLHLAPASASFPVVLVGSSPNSSSLPISRQLRRGVVTPALTTVSGRTRKSWLKSSNGPL